MTLPYISVMFVIDEFIYNNKKGISMKTLAGYKSNRKKIYLSLDSNKHVVRMPFPYRQYPYVIEWNYCLYQVNKEKGRWYIMERIR